MSCNNLKKTSLSGIGQATGSPVPNSSHWSSQCYDFMKTFEVFDMEMIQ